jgi:uncharacterized membrane protein
MPAQPFSRYFTAKRFTGKFVCNLEGGCATPIREGGRLLLYKVAQANERGGPREVAMEYCSKCGAQAEGNYCARCGARVSGAKVKPFRKPAAGRNAKLALSANLASALCYLFGFLSGTVFLLWAPYREQKLVRFQSIFLSASVVLLHIALTIVALALVVVSLSLGVIVSSLHAVLNVGFFAVLLYLMWKCYEGQMVSLPVLGEMAERLAGGEEPGAPLGSGTIGKAA